IHEMAMGERDGAIEAEVRAGALSAEDRAAIARLGEILDEEAIVPDALDGAAAPATAVPSAAATRLRVGVADESRLPEIARALVERGVPLYELRVARKSLEAWFLDVMGEEQRPG
ncbi:MAG TPA: hypothetical protein VFT32_07930, partial [Candidatus Eisenbacteria bacterium]|nr:hypothetical protein [Candidatus Eisenbacteria bacterium]